MIISKTETHIVVAVKIAKATLFRNVRFNSTRVLRLPTGPGCRLCGSPATRVFPLRAPLCRVLDYAEHPALWRRSLKESNSLARVTRHNHRVARNAMSLSVGL